MRETSVVTPIAVVGMACRLPGGINSPEELWDALLRGDDFVTTVPPDRWDADEYYDPERGVPGRSISRWGAFIDDIAGFDAPFFGLDDRKAAVIDPQHRLLLETSWEAVERAGMDPSALAGSRTGVFVGLSHEDHTVVTLDTGTYGFTGTASCMASGRIAYVLDTQGPALTFDTACSSGLLAIHMACRSLDSGESDLALAGGCQVMMEPRKNPWASAQGMLSPTGRCRAFDTAADGFVRSEGTVMVLLKRLPDALRDGDPVLAVVRGTAANSDGRTRTISTPSLEAQVAACRSALAAAGVDPETVGAVEAHGTGTPVGDPIEFSSLAQVYGTTGPCLLGSAKSNFGHTEAAAGALGLIKAVLEVQHGVVPKMVHFSELPTKLAEIKTGLMVPSETTPWLREESSCPRRIAVSSYGISGTNVHAIVEQAPEGPDGAIADDARGPLMFVLSSTSADELRRTAARLADWVDEHADSVALSDVAYTLACRRGHRPVRTAVMAADIAELTERLREVSTSDIPYPAASGQDDRGPVWVFSGQGSQWAAMGADLMDCEPVFAATIGALEPLIAEESGFSVTDAITASEVVTGIERVQPTLFAMQVALAEALKAHGVRPGAVIGHSMGEAAAAVVSGALSMKDGVRVICRRSRLLARLSGAGAMASVELPAHRVREELTARGVNDVVVAVVASPQSTVIGGETVTVRRLVAEWESEDVLAREVAVDVASHSPQVDAILDELADVLADLAPMAPEVPFYSATQFDPRDHLDCNADYWVDNLRHMVRFASAVQAALEDGYRVFAELSPHPLLIRAVEQTAQESDTPVTALPSLRREQPTPHGLLDVVADLHCAGAALDFSALMPGGRLVDAPLPSWTHRHLLITREADDGQTRGVNKVYAHPLLGAHVRLPEFPERHVWQAELGTASLPWLSDHQVHHVAAFPGAAYCEMALAAAGATLGETCEVQGIRFEEMLLPEEQTCVTSVASAAATGVLSFAVETVLDGENVRLASATLRSADTHGCSHYNVDELLARHPRRIDGVELRERFSARGVQYGPAFCGLTAANVSDGSADSVLAEVALPGPLRSQQLAYGVHPALLDACFQSVAAHPMIQKAGAETLLLPLGVRSLRAFGSARQARYCYTRVTSVKGAGLEADIDLLDEAGAVLLSVEGLSVGSAAGESSQAERVLSDRLLTVEWKPRELPEMSGASIGSYLLVSISKDGDLLSSALSDALKFLEVDDVATVSWAQQADHAATPDRFRSLLTGGGVDNVVVVTDTWNGCSEEQLAQRGAEHVRQLVRISRELAEFGTNSPRLYVVTRSAQSVLSADRPNLEQAGIRGLIRTIGAEHPHLRPTQIDVDETTEARLVARQLLANCAEDETAFRSGEWYTAHLSSSPLRPDERHKTIVDNARDGMRLEIRTPGDLQTLELTSFRRTPPGPGQIEVAVSASSVNFADVLVAFGRYPSFGGGRPQLGLDFAGVVTAVGQQVTSHRVGDHVGGMSPNGCWGTSLTCDANVAVTLPRGLRDDQAAAVSAASATAWYGLHDLARIKAGDKVLIHSATGGVGQAAIAIARAAGAEIFATAGTPERRNLLRDMGVKHVYDSRTTAFGEEIRRDTDGYGVDIVLNSLIGAAQRTGVESLAFGGRFVEIGKKDIYGDTRMGLFPFRRNLSFYAVDLALMAKTHPHNIKDLLSTVYRLTAEGVLPQPETAHYPLADAASAIRAMAAAEHTGKLVLSVPKVGHSSVVVPPEQVRVFRRDGSYIVTGGLGGLGLFLASKMAAAGCGRIILNARSEPKSEAAEEIARLRAGGTEVDIVLGDVAVSETVDRLVTAATATGLPLRGVLHAAAVVEDAVLTNITDELIDRDWAPKVYGAWHLHRATVAQPLDWFCSFSSAAALVGSPGQGAYAAANSWLDAFTHWRRSRGLPATVIAWGPWGQIGAGAHLAAASGDIAMIDPEEGAYAFEALLRHDRAHCGYLPVTGTPWLKDLAHRSPFAAAFLSTADAPADSSTFRRELQSLPREEWPSALRRLISEQLNLILRRSVDPDRAISEYGLDSLGSLELRTRIETETGLRIRSMDITTIRSLAESLCDALAASATPSNVGI